MLKRGRVSSQIDRSNIKSPKLKGMMRLKSKRSFQSQKGDASQVKEIIPMSKVQS